MNIPTAVTLLMGLLLGQSRSQAQKIDNEPLVCGREFGCVRGKYLNGYDTRLYEAFLGIPYALPPVNIDRFGVPIPVSRFTSTYDATKIKPDCIQKNYLLPNRPVTGEEDCLYLNVYRPTKKGNSSLPVMVFIHGGFFFSGTSSPSVYGPDYFMDTKQVILVTFNYRLGPFGFLSTGDGEIAGNMGLKDQNLVLWWVKYFISDFGGDPHNVTLFGHGSGAVSAHMHILSRMSRGLFHRVISLSGTANTPYAVNENPLDQALTLANLCTNLNLTRSDGTRKLAEAIRSVDAVTLLNAGDGLKYWNVENLVNYRPVVENHDHERFLDENPTDIMVEGLYADVPWMTGFVPHEGAIRVIQIIENDTLRNSFNTDIKNFLERLLEFPESMNETFRKGALGYYADGKHLEPHKRDILMSLITERFFIVPLYNAIKQHVHTVRSPLYFYRFNYKGTNTFANIYAGHEISRKYDVVHGDDLIYLFRMPANFPDLPKNSTDAAVMRAYVDNFVEFAKTGKPQKTDCLKPCNIASFREDSFCDYQDFMNYRENDFRISPKQTFPFSGVIHWNKYLGAPHFSHNLPWHRKLDY